MKKESIKSRLIDPSMKAFKSRINKPLEQKSLMKFKINGDRSSKNGITDRMN